MADLISATKFIKDLNPKNKSGAIPQALDLLTNLKNSQGNSKMIDSVGPAVLMQAVSFLAKLFSQKKGLLKLSQQVLSHVAGLSKEELAGHVRANLSVLSQAVLDKYKINANTIFEQLPIETLEVVNAEINTVILAIIQEAKNNALF